MFPKSKSVELKWEPPLSQDVKVRGYTIGWGRGVPDVYKRIVDKNLRSYNIENLGEFFIRIF